MSLSSSSSLRRHSVAHVLSEGARYSSAVLHSNKRAHMASVVLDKVTKRFGSIVAVDNVDLSVAHGEFLVLLGPSGCGKSTLLRMLAGLESPTSGRVVVGGEVMNSVDARARDVAFVFQSYALYPHMTVRRNLSFPLIMRQFKPWYHIPGIGALQRRRLEKTPEIAGKVEAVAASLGLEQLLDRRPGTLSGGQRQRVAVGRAIVRAPKLFLMDEPLSNLDANLRVQTRTELSRLHRNLNTTFVYVTHDQTEALSLGTSVLVLNHGRVQQFGSPREIFNSPANVFVARFIGSPPMNLLHVSRLDAGELYVSGIRIEAPSVWEAKLRSVRDSVDDLLLGIRPDAVHLTEPGSAGSLAARVVGVENTGIDTVVALELADKKAHWRAASESTGDTKGLDPIYARVPTYLELKPDENVGCKLNVSSITLFRRSTGERVAI